MQNFSNSISIATPELNAEEFINTFSQRGHDSSGLINQESLKLYFKTFAKMQTHPNFETCLNGFFSNDIDGKIKRELSNIDFLQEVFIEALKHNNFRLINKIIGSVDDKNNLKILTNILQDEFLDMNYRKKLSTTLPFIILKQKFENKENIMHLIASNNDLKVESLNTFKFMFDKYDDKDFITHLLDSKNEQGKTPFDIARENNNKAFIDNFTRNPYITEIKIAQQLIQKKIDKKSCVLG